MVNDWGFLFVFVFVVFVIDVFFYNNWYFLYFVENLIKVKE